MVLIMGWTFIHRRKDVSAKQMIQKEYDGHTIALSGVHDGAIYGAYTREDGKTIGIVFLIEHVKNDFYNFGYKEIDETCGPLATNCPRHILNKLSPVEDLYIETRLVRAQKWRTACRENITRRH